MTPDDNTLVGFKPGLGIRQQLLTAKKLSPCPLAPLFERGVPLG
jgi:hypothetical protein